MITSLLQLPGARDPPAGVTICKCLTHLVVYTLPLFLLPPFLPALVLSCSLLAPLLSIPLSCNPQKLLDNLDDASAELMLADDDEPVRMRVGDCFWGIDKTAAEEKLEALTEEAQQQYRQLEQQMAGAWLQRAVVASVGALLCLAGAATQTLWDLGQEQEQRQQQSRGARLLRRAKQAFRYVCVLAVLLVLCVYLMVCPAVHCCPLHDSSPCGVVLS
jgi:hypothetical protein